MKKKLGLFLFFSFFVLEVWAVFTECVIKQGNVEILKNMLSEECLQSRSANFIEEGDYIYVSSWDKARQKGLKGIQENGQEYCVSFDAGYRFHRTCIIIESLFFA